MVDCAERRLAQALDDDVVTVVQERPLGTADAVRAATDEFATAGTVLVLNGDAPLIEADTLRDLVAAHESQRRGGDDRHDDARGSLRLRAGRARP